MNLMIVEDEVRLRNSLVNNIPWEENGIEVIAQAASGAEALYLFERKKPDIVLLDVQMPEMDGLTLAKKLREKDAFIKMIILSGHDNFGFAQLAMEAGVSNYLLKPAGDEEILATVLSAAESLRQELDRWHSQAELQEKWSEHLPQLQTTFFQNLISGKYDLWEIRKISRDYLLNLDETMQYTVALADVDPLALDEPRYKSGDMPLLRFSLQCVAREFLQNHGCWVFTDSNGFTLILFAMPGDDKANDVMLRVNAAIVKLLSQVKECLKITCSAGISGGTGSLDEVSKLYSQAYQALQDRIVYGSDIAIPYQDKPAGSTGVPLANNSEKTLEIALETSDENKALEALAELWSQGMEQSGTVAEMHEGLMYWSSLIIRIIHKQGWRVQDVVREDYVYYQDVTKLTTKQQIHSWLERTVRKFIAHMQEQRKTTSHQVVKTILSIVEAEIDSDITLHSVADRLYVNSSYLSRLFKQETGVAFSAYVLDRKMDRAKAALLDGAKVYDAARIVGYRDVSYFTKVFRKYWGVTPGEMKH
ncbi:response regulator [Paenibacillus sp. FJAT-26967]|uniref:response regulator transcription factor n=1 Tax=Paenibacillus sp. FJAT-26967 TaxID=1729690 RepID=UPI000838F4E2|nr:response regulator [Paenibacillus sp. FJAT-26967]